MKGGSARSAPGDGNAAAHAAQAIADALPASPK